MKHADVKETDGSEPCRSEVQMHKGGMLYTGDKTRAAESAAGSDHPFLERMVSTHRLEPSY